MTTSMPPVRSQPSRVRSGSAALVRRPRFGFRGGPTAAAAALLFSAGMAFLSLPAASAADSEPFPSRPIKVVVPFSAGGGTDTYARIIAEAIQRYRLLPQPMVVINMPGAGATAGSGYVKNAEPDGYTLLLLHDTIVTARLSGAADYGPEAFEPIAGTTEVGMVIAVSQRSPYRSLGELMRAARQHPGRIAFGANLGALTHYAGLQLEHAAPGTRFRFVQSGGGAERFADLRGGHIDVTGFSLEEFLRFRSDGLRALAYFGERRHPALPDVPTAIEQGFAAAMSNTFYWWAPKGTPRERIDRIAEALQAALQTPYVLEKLRAMHCDPLFVRGEALRRRIAATETRLAALVVRNTTPLPDLPRAVVTLAIVLAIAAVGRELRRQHMRRHRPQLAGGSPTPTATTPLADATASSTEGPPAGENAASPLTDKVRMATAAGLLAAYAALTFYTPLGFRGATPLFVLAFGNLAAPGRRLRDQAALAALGLLLAFGLHAVFTHLLVVALP